MVADDAQTIQAVVAGDVERYAQLVDKYQVSALRMAFGLLGNYEDAKDMAQEAFISAYQGLGRFRQDAKFSTWLYRIVVNQCKDFHRHRSRRPNVVASIGQSQGPELANEEGLFMDVADSVAHPAEQLANRELARQISLAIEALALNQRTAFVLHRLHGLSLDEVADVMGCRVGTVKSHLFRATAHLRSRLAPWWKQESV